MTALLLAVALAQPPADTVRPTRPDSAVQHPADPWFGEDKLKHFILAGMVQGTAFGVATAVGVERRPALLASSAVVALVSLGKEWHDRRQGRAFSYRDLAWDAAGAFLWGALVARSGR
jgi:putative lipoprotein